MNKTIIPHITVIGGAAAINFYQKAFGFEVIENRATADGKVLHAELRLGDAKLFLNDEFPWGDSSKSPLTVGGVSVTLGIETADCDAAYQRAVDAGATGALRPQNMFWGDRYAKLVDPFGHSWELSQHVEDVSEEELQRRMASFSVKPGK